MNKILVFIFSLFKEVKEDDLLSIANDLTYKMLLSLFPLIIFMLSVIGYFDINVQYLKEQLNNALPDTLTILLETFIDEIVNTKSPSILSTSLLFATFSASSGFNSVIKCINKAYRYKDERNIFKQRLISVVLVFVFTSAIIFSMVSLIFSDYILAFINKYITENYVVNYLFGFMGTIGSMVIILLAVIIINLLAVSRRVTVKSVLPGSILTVAIWYLASLGFNIYVNNFSRYSAVYGSVASIMILMIWLNIICMVLLLGSEVNAILEKNGAWHIGRKRKEKAEKLN